MTPNKDNKGSETYKLGNVLAFWLNIEEEKLMSLYIPRKTLAFKTCITQKLLILWTQIP